MKKRNQRPEEVCQIAIVKKVLKPLERLGYLTYAHSPNELARTPFLRILMTAMGMKPGINDLIIFINAKLNNGQNVPFIELKMIGEPQKTAQISWQERIEALGYTYYLVEMADKFDGQRKVMDILAANGVPILKISVDAF